MSFDSSEQTRPKGIRITELSRELGVKPKLVINCLPSIGVTEKKTHSSWISLAVADKIRNYFSLLAEEAKSAVKPATAKPGPETAVASQPAVMARAALRPVPSTPPGAVSAKPGFPEASVGASAASLSKTEPVVIRLPRRFTFHRGFVDFDFIFDCFNWSLTNAPVLFDLTSCESANFQALVLLIQYAWFLTMKGCQVTFRYGLSNSGPTKMLSKMGALDWHQVLTTDGKNFGNYRGQTLALRRRSDVQNAINIARRAIKEYKVGFPDYLSYIVSELLYNATEHGAKSSLVENCRVIVPSVFQFGRYPASERLSFFFSDLGVGIKAHLERAYQPFPTHQDAIVYALRPHVSGTFSGLRSPYVAKDNAGMGLTYSHLMLKRLKGDMHIVSYNGQAHLSPEDVTTHSLKHAWPGTFVLVDLNISEAPQVSLEDLLAEIRGKANEELSEAEKQDQANRYYVNIENYFGKWAEDKDAAIKFRDNRLMPAVLDGKKIDLDFRGVETVPHSFLNALLATPVQRLGVKAYQWIRVYNAPGSIHEIIRTIFEDNLPQLN